VGASGPGGRGLAIWSDGHGAGADPGAGYEPVVAMLSAVGLVLPASLCAPWPPLRSRPREAGPARSTSASRALRQRSRQVLAADGSFAWAPDYLRAAGPLRLRATLPACLWYHMSYWIWRYGK